MVRQQQPLLSTIATTPTDKIRRLTTKDDTCPGGIMTIINPRVICIMLLHQQQATTVE